MFELITEANREFYFRRLYIDEQLLKKQRLQDTIAMGLLFTLLGFAFVYIAKFHILAIIGMVFFGILGAYIGYKSKYFAIKNSVAVQDNKVALMFPEFLQTFISLMDANPSASIVTILESTVPYLKIPIKNEVMKLVKAIYTDGRNESVRRSMMTFAQYMNTDEAMRIMMLVYSMYEEGANPSMLKELEEKVDQLNTNKIDAYVSKKGGSLAGRSFPSLVLGLVFIFGYVGLLFVQYAMNAISMM